MKQRLLSLLLVLAGVTLGLTGCGAGEPVPAERHVKTDMLISDVRKNLAAAPGLIEIAEIDHSRLAQQAGSIMPPARVLIFSNSQLESELIAQNPLVALDLPLRVLAFEDTADASRKIIYNSFDYLVSRYDLDESSSALREQYNESVNVALDGLPSDVVSAFSNDVMSPDGIVTIESPYGYEETIERVNTAIDEQDDTMHFGTVDFQARARASGVEVGAAYLILFGGPAPGGKAMANAPTLGLDGFCQKFLIWEDDSGQVRLSFNDLLALAERQEVKKSIALRVINYRLNKAFSDALAQQ